MAEKTKTVRINMEFVDLIKKVKKYMIDTGYNSFNPSDAEVSKFILERIKRRDLRGII